MSSSNAGSASNDESAPSGASAPKACDRLSSPSNGPAARSGTAPKLCAGAGAGAAGGRPPPAAGNRITSVSDIPGSAAGSCVIGSSCSDCVPPSTGSIVFRERKLENSALRWSTSTAAGVVSSKTGATGSGGCCAR